MDRTNLARKAHLLRLQAVTLAHGMKTGSFRSLYRGQGVDFIGDREYLLGDDTRNIDWNVTARIGRPYVKVFEEERELNVFLILDKSTSMTTGSVKQTRMETAVEACSLMALACQFNNSPVGAVVFDGEISFDCPPRNGMDNSMFLVSQFNKDIEDPVEGSALGSALKGACRILKKRSLVMIFSDFRSTDWLEHFGRLCAKHDVVACRITDPVDETIPPLGTVSFIDTESGKTSVLPTSRESFAREWKNSNYRRVDTWKHECYRHGAIPLVMSTVSDPAAVLTSFFVSRDLG